MTASDAPDEAAPASILHAAMGLTSLGANGSPSGGPPTQPQGPPAMSLKSDKGSPLHKPAAATAAASGAVPAVGAPAMAAGLLPLTHPAHPSATALLAAASLPAALQAQVAPAGYGAQYAPAPAFSQLPYAAAPGAIGPAMGAYPAHFMLAQQLAGYHPASAAGLPHWPHAGQSPLHPASAAKTFPETLFEVVSLPENASMISWLPHGKGFIVHDKKRFEALVLPKYFQGTKFTSFTRRLNRWNLTRVPRGPEMGAYYNPNFLRGMPQLVEDMTYKMEGFDKERLIKNKRLTAEKNAKKRGGAVAAETTGDEGKSEEEPQRRPRKKRALKKTPAEYRPQIPPHLFAGAVPGQEAAVPANALPLPSSLPRPAPHLVSQTSSISSHAALAGEGRPELRLMELQREMLLRQVPSMANGLPGSSVANYAPVSSRALQAEALAQAVRAWGLASLPPGLPAGLAAAGVPAAAAPTTRPRSDSQSVLMSQKEQAEFAEYLLMKRKSNPALEE